MKYRVYTEQIESWLYKKKVLILYGARQVGKTTLLKVLQEKHDEMLILSSENPTVKTALESKNLSRIKLLFGNAKIVAIDEAQKIENIGEVLKYLHDLNLGVQLIATGSSSFDLSNKITEPLTGRNIKFTIYPYSLNELIQHHSGLWVVENLERLLIFGQYPEIVDAPMPDVPPLLKNLASDYLFQDILQLENLRNSNILFKLLTALALQLGGEVSYNDVAQTVGVSVPTVEKYIDLLEKNFIIYSLHSFSRNLRNELKKSKKVYFYDLGIRNAVLANFAPLTSRNDVGGLWENFCINERKKFHVKNQSVVNLYFWRTYDQAEIDLVEESNGKLTIFEFKYNAKKGRARFPISFLENYDIHNKRVITSGNFEELIL